MEPSNPSVLTDMPELSLTNMNDSQVQALRQQLQSDISDLISEKSFEMELQKRKILYNRVMDALHNRDKSPRVDPVEKLPSDIMAEIILYMSDHSDFILDLLDLTLVSKKWRAFILSEPFLWNHIDLYNRHDSHAILSLQVHFSGRLPLQIEFYLPWILAYPELLHPVLLNHRSRIESIEFRPVYTVAFRNTDNNDQRLWKVLGGLGSLPNLRRIVNSWINRGEYYNVKRVLDTYPSLVKITGIPFTIADLQASKDRLDISQFMTSDDIEISLPILETKKELRKVSLLTAYSEPQQEGPTSEEYTKQSTSTHQLGWTELMYSSYPHQIPLSFLRRVLSLARLDVSITIDGLNTIITTIHQLQNLDDVKLDIVIDNNSTLSVPVDLSSNPSVRRLDTTATCSETALSSQGIENQGSFMAGDCLADILLRIMPNVDELTLMFYHTSSPFPLPIFEERFSGTNLVLILHPGSTGASDRILLHPSTQKVQLSCDRDVACLLSSEQVKHLCVDEAPLGKDMIKGLDLRLDLDDWPALDNLQIHEDVVEWGKSSLAFLRFITIGINKNRPRGNGITSFIRHLACHTISYPSLEGISLGGCPEWDILMIMLERRNLLQELGIKRITRFGLRSPCSSEILRIINTLLQGKWADRPSNRDLSLVGNAEIFLDLELPGCYLCHRGLRFCDAEVEDFPDEYDPEALMGELPAYPDNEDDILSTWDERFVSVRMGGYHRRGFKVERGWGWVAEVAVEK
ncbi:hypothetical protein CPB86DRAFT_829481 [Serendipita vermifera]|nr:hypothetical protein CPB86DRAFT_829481 [Serendipita vermifera]